MNGWPRVPVGEQALVRRPRCGSRAPRRVASRSSSTSGPGSSPGNSSPSTRNSKSVLTRSARIASSTPGYCTFTATATPVVRHRAVHLADRRGRDRDRVPLREHALGIVAELGAHDRRRQLRRHRRRVLLQRRERVAHGLRAARRRGSSPSGRSSSARPSSRRARRRPRRRCAAGTAASSSARSLGRARSRAGRVWTAWRVPRARRRPRAARCAPPIDVVDEAAIGGDAARAPTTRRGDEQPRPLRPRAAASIVCRSSWRRYRRRSVHLTDRSSFEE